MLKWSELFDEEIKIWDPNILTFTRKGNQVLVALHVCFNFPWGQNSYLKILSIEA